MTSTTEFINVLYNSLGIRGPLDYSHLSPLQINILSNMSFNTLPSGDRLSRRACPRRRCERRLCTDVLCMKVRKKNNVCVPTAYSPHQDNHISPYMSGSQSVSPAPLTTPRYSPLPRAMTGEDDVPR